MLQRTNVKIIPPSEDKLYYQIFQKAFENQGYHLSTLIKMATVCPILCALVKAHLQYAYVPSSFFFLLPSLFFFILLQITSKFFHSPDHGETFICLLLCEKANH